MTIADKLRKVLNTKNALKQALIDKGIEVSDTDSFESYVDKIQNMSGGVPKGFTELKYLEKTTQTNYYVDLGYKANKNTKIELDFEINSWTTDTQGLLGYDSGTTSTSFGIYLWKYATTDTDKVCSGTALTSSSIGGQRVTIIPSQKYTYMLAPDAFIVNGTTVSSFTGQTDTTTAGNLFVFRVNATNSYYGTAKGCVSGKIYGLKIYESDELVRDFVPAQRKDTLAFGLYDKVTGYFLPVSLNSSFTGVAKE